MAADLELRPAEPDDLDAILSLMRASLGVGSIPRERRFWEWKHERNPFGRSPVLVACAGQELVGMRVFMRWEWVSGGRTYRAVRAVDTATHPAWQGKGIFKRLTLTLADRMAEEGVHFIYNTPNDQSRPGYLKMGWTSVGRTDLLIRPLHPARLVRAVAGRGTARSAIPAPLVSEDGSEPAAVALARNEVAAFADRTVAESPTGRFTTARSAAYLRWRYGDVPGFDYRLTAAVEGSEGAVIIHRDRERGPLRELRICDLLIGDTPSSRAAARALLRRLHARPYVDYVSAMAAPGSAARSVLLRAGYLPAWRLGPILTVRPLNPAPGAPNPRLRSAWAASIGDLELF